MAGAETEQAQKGRAGATAGGYCRLLEGRQFFFFFLIILAALSLHCHTLAFSSCGRWGLLIAIACLVAENQL